MTIEELINTLSQYPQDLDLTEIKVSLGIEIASNKNYIQSAYMADHRIVGGHPWGRLWHLERQTNLKEVATSLLHGLKINGN